MLARQRSGTNPLRSVLESHPDIFCTPEILHPEPSPEAELEVETNYFEFLERHTAGAIKPVLTSWEEQGRIFVDYLRFLRCFSDKRYVLLDVKYNSTHHMDGPWREISAQPGLFRLIKQNHLHVLNLARRNYLRFYLSWMKANLTERWTIDSDATRSQEVVDADPRVVVPVDDLMYMLDLSRSETDMVSRSFEDYQPRLEIEYDDLFPQMDGEPSRHELGRLAAWLGIEDRFPALKPRYRKQAVRPLQDTIRNYDEVVAALRGTEFEYCLADEQMYRGSPVAAH